MTMIRTTFIASAAAVLLSGCATFIHGPFQDVRIESVPPGAKVSIAPTQSERGPLFLDEEKEREVTTPATVRLKRDNTYRLEFSKPGYKIGFRKVESGPDWLLGFVSLCGACEFLGDLPDVDVKDRALPVRFAEQVFYAYPKGFARAVSRSIRLISPEAIMGTTFKLRPDDGGFLSDWHGLGTPVVSQTLERLD